MNEYRTVNNIKNLSLMYHFGIYLNMKLFSTYVVLNSFIDVMLVTVKQVLM